MAGHGPETNGGHHGDIGEDYNIATIVTVAVVGCLGLLITILWLRAMFARAERWEWERKVVTAVFEERTRLHEQQLVKLDGNEWVDPAHNKVSIPLGEARGRALAQMLQLQSAAQHAASLAPPSAAPVEAVPADATGSVTAAEAAAPTGQPADAPAETGGNAAEHPAQS